jgi:uncharacterized protein
MQTYFFNTAQEPLYGIYRPPRARSGREDAVLLCPSIAHEYVRAHRALRQVADQLVQAGCHTFRFDPSGLGDSWGTFADASVARWRADLGTAIAELRDNSGVRRISLLGLRLGATLACAAARSNPARQLVLWDPVVQGGAFVSELRSLQRERERQWKHLKTAPPGAPHEDLLGFRYGADLVRAIEALDLLAAPAPVADRVRVVVSADRPEYHALVARWAGDGLKVEYTVVADAGDWDDAELSTRPLIPGKLPRALAEAVTRDGA